VASAAVAPSSTPAADHVVVVSSRIDHRNVGAPVVNPICPAALIRSDEDWSPTALNRAPGTGTAG